MFSSITDVAGIEVGHYTNQSAATGCTVLLAPNGAVAGVDVRGSAPGTRETDLLRTGNLVEKIHAIGLSGGSAFGLDTASGIVRYLEEKGIGFPIGSGVVPIVPAAIIFDLGLGGGSFRPGAEEGYQACLNASDSMVEQGSVGAGTGATVGKILGREQSTKGGLGSYSLKVGSVTIGALAVVNAFGDVIDPKDGKTIAGPRKKPAPPLFENTVDLLINPDNTSQVPELSPTNTTLAVVACDATLTKEQANKLAQVGQDGLALAVRPSHTMVDGDIVFALATGNNQEPPNMRSLCAAASVVVSKAIINGVLAATAINGIPSVKDLGILQS